MSQLKSIANVLLTKTVGFLIFLVLIGLANTLLYYIPNENFYSIVGFLNSNIWLIITFTLILFIGEIFGILVFPLNLPSPLFNGVGSILLVRFVFNILIFVDSLTGIHLAIPYELLYILIAFLVLIIVIIVGYIEIFREIARPKKKLKIKKKSE